MELLTNFKDYIFDFMYQNKNIVFNYDHLNTKLTITSNFINNIDYDNESVFDIVNKINNFKHKYNIQNINYENLNVLDKKDRLKYILYNCIELEKDTTDIMVKNIRKYKGISYEEKNINKNEKISHNTIDEDIIELERRYLNLVNEEVEDDDGDNDNNEDDDNSQSIIIKKKIKLLS